MTKQPSPTQARDRKSPRRRLDQLARRIFPSVPALSHNRVLMLPLDLADRAVSGALGVGAELPPNRMRIRIGAGNRLLFNQVQHLHMAVPFWMDRLECGEVRADSRICDIGCGCGRYASALHRCAFKSGPGFSGHYTGIDIDKEMIQWCRGHFPKDRFSFQLADMRSTIYNPDGSESLGARLDLDDDSQDFVFSVSLFTHLLEQDIEAYLREAARVLRAGGRMRMTVFCLEDLRATGALGGRWTFKHRRGDAYIESERFPEAAVAYDRDWLLGACERAGLVEARVLPAPGQSALIATAG